VRVYDEGSGTAKLVDEFKYNYTTADCSSAPNTGRVLEGVHQGTTGTK